jgi:FtsP/CotA-like multicopper oxidase with cupredoxin domain
MKRRYFLGAALSTTILPRIGFASNTPFHLKAERVKAQIAPVGDTPSNMFGFNGSMPGPEIRSRQGQRMMINFENALNQRSSIHWHGLRIENAMDGVPNLTQELVKSGDNFEYAFTPPDAGTFWYHSHHISHEQVAKGMMGPLIVDELTPPDVDHDITVIIADWVFNNDGTLNNDFGDMHSMAHGGRLGNYARAFMSKDTVQKGDRLRLRLINTATDRIFPVGLLGATGKVVALDGMPLNEPRAFETVELAPAQRADLIVDVTENIEIGMLTRDGTFPLGQLLVEGQNTNRQKSPIAPLPMNKVATPETATQNLTLNMMGGAMSRRHKGSDIWAFNDISGLDDEPFGSFKRGETARITLMNDTSFPHGIHLHGHHFYEVSKDGSLGDLRDTTLVDARESIDIVCVFDNPGKWLLHCHMLSHQAAGMKTWIKVS